MIAPVSRAEKRRLPFNLDQLNRIFHAPLYGGSASSADITHREGQFWVPLIGLWTGMRLGEIVPLRTDDIELIDDVAVIHVRIDEENQKRVKTPASVRSIPVHNELKKIGFLGYAEAMRQRGDVRLFPELPKSAKGYYSDPFQKWFSRFLSNIGAKTSKTSFHSFRHCFRDALREAQDRLEVSTDIVRDIGGWARLSSAEAGYGLGHRPSALAQAIEKVYYPGLDLSHLYVST
jgi:integrase